MRSGWKNWTRNNAPAKSSKRLKIVTEPDTRLHLMIAMTQREKFEWILQKSCEIGVYKITPIMSERSIQIPSSDFQKKKERWERILKEASEQSRRGMIPVLNVPIPIQEAFNDPAPLRLIAWENEQNRGLNDIFTNQNSAEVTLLIGPEGGFSEPEIQAAQSKGWIPFSLGKRILRMETAAIVASALILHHMWGYLTLCGLNEDRGTMLVLALSFLFCHRWVFHDLKLFLHDHA